MGKAKAQGWCEKKTNSCWFCQVATSSQGSDCCQSGEIFHSSHQLIIDYNSYFWALWYEHHRTPDCVIYRCAWWWSCWPHHPDNMNWLLIAFPPIKVLQSTRTIPTLSWTIHTSSWRLSISARALTRYHIDHITIHHNTSHHITSHHITLQSITWYHNLSYLITSDDLILAWRALLAVSLWLKTPGVVHYMTNNRSTILFFCRTRRRVVRIRIGL